MRWESAKVKSKNKYVFLHVWSDDTFEVMSLDGSATVLIQFEETRTCDDWARNIYRNIVAQNNLSVSCVLISSKTSKTTRLLRLPDYQDYQTIKTGRLPDYQDYQTTSISDRIRYLFIYLNLFLDCTRINDPQGTFQISW